MKTPLLVLIISILISDFLFAQTDWSMVSNNKDRTAYAHAEELIPPLLIDEYFNIYGESAVTFGDIIYITDGGPNNQLTAFDRNQKMELWTFVLPGGVSSVGNVPAVDGDLVFIGGQQASGLYALNRHTGLEQWMKPIGSLYSRNAVPDGQGHVYIASQDSFYCLNTSDGTTVWVNDRGGTFTPTLHGEYVYYNRGSTLFMLNALTGLPGWSRPHTNGPRGQVMAADNIIYNCIKDQICAYAENAYEYWCYTLPDGQVIADFSGGSAILSDSVLCFVIWSGVNGNSSLVALNRSTGEKRWQYNFETEGISSPSAANGIVYVNGNYQNWLRGFDIMTGELVFEDLSLQYWGQPIISDNRLYALGLGGISVFKTDLSSTDDIELNDKVHCYPNPFAHEMTIGFNDDIGKIEEVTMVDITGSSKKIESKLENENSIEIKTSNMDPGLYFLQLRIGEQIITKKLLKVN